MVMKTLPPFQKKKKQNKTNNNNNKSIGRQNDHYSQNSLSAIININQRCVTANANRKVNAQEDTTRVKKR